MLTRSNTSQLLRRRPSTRTPGGEKCEPDEEEDKIEGFPVDGRLRIISWIKELAWFIIQEYYVVLSDKGEIYCLIKLNSYVRPMS